MHDSWRSYKFRTAIGELSYKLTYSDATTISSSFFQQISTLLHPTNILVVHFRVPSTQPVKELCLNPLKQKN